MVTHEQEQLYIAKLTLFFTLPLRTTTISCMLHMVAHCRYYTWLSIIKQVEGSAKIEECGVHFFASVQGIVTLMGDGKKSGSCQLPFREFPLIRREWATSFQVVR